MYPQILTTMVRTTVRGNEALRAYSRWEYGTADEGWLLAAIREARKGRSRGLGRRLIAALRSVPAEAAVDDRKEASF